MIRSAWRTAKSDPWLTPRHDMIRAMKIKVHAALLLGCAALAAIPVETSATLFENEQVKVLRALEKPT